MSELRLTPSGNLLLVCSYGENPLAKGLERCHYNVKQGGWEYKPTLETARRIRSAFPEMVMSKSAQSWFDWAATERESILAAKSSEDATLHTGVASRLYPFQRVGVDFMVKAKRVLLADDMGLGKTLQSIVACEELGAERVLVICPNTLKATWQNEVRKWTPERAVTVFKGSNHKKKEATIASYTTGYFVTNYEAIRRGKEKRMVDGEEKVVDRAHDFLDDLSGISWDVAIIDEAHRIKNRKAQQTQDATAVVKKAKYLFLLTGTPIMNRVDELWSLLNVLYPKVYSSFWEFVQKFADAHPGQFGWVINPSPTNPGKLRKQLENLFIRREKEEVFKDMPPKTYQQIWVDLEGKQRDLYQQMEQEALADVNETDQVVALGILAQIVRLKQIAFSPALIGGDHISSKVEALMDILSGTDEKVVVFSQFAEVLKLVAKELDDNDIRYAMFAGDTKEEVRQHNLEWFQKDPNAKVFLATTQAGGVGITLTAASYVVMLDKHWTPAVNEQAVDRVYRHGQTKPVTIFEILATDTVDEMVEQVLSGKHTIIEAVIARKREKS